MITRYAKYCRKQIFRFGTAVIIISSTAIQIITASVPFSNTHALTTTNQKRSESLIINKKDKKYHRDSVPEKNLHRRFEQLKVSADTLIKPLPVKTRKDIVKSTEVQSEKSDTLTRDSLARSTETKAFYDSLRVRSERSFWARYLYGWMIASPQSAKAQVEVNSEQSFKPFAGKRIGHIRIQQLDVFGPSIQDTSIVLDNWLAKVGNGIHVKTRDWVLRKNLLFKTGDIVDPRTMAEDEKLIRDLPYIKDVSIILIPDQLNSQIVDVLIVTKDNFSWGFLLDINGSKSARFDLFNQNMFGLGHEFSVGTVYHSHESPTVGFHGFYGVNNIAGKFINGAFRIEDTYRKNAISAMLEKRFLTTKTRNAGGISFNRVFRFDYLTDDRIMRLDTTISLLDMDAWYGHSFERKKETQAAGHFIIAGSISSRRFFDRPTVSPQRNQLFHDHHIILGSVAYSKRFLQRNNLVYGYGITEDIPYGDYFELTSGYDFGEFYNRSYLHLYYSKGMVLPDYSYLRFGVGAGSFFHHSNLEQTTIMGEGNFFSRLYNIDGHRLRQFINMRYIIGLNHFNQEYLTLNDEWGIRGFRTDYVRGTQKLTVNMEAVTFLRSQFYGFRFAPYCFSDLGFIGDNTKFILNQDFYAGVGLGFRIRNESLVINTFEFRLTWFPVTPPNIHPWTFRALGQPKAEFNDFLGRRPEILPYH